MSEVPESPEIACNRQAKSRNACRKWVLTVRKSRVRSQWTDGGNDEGTLAVRSPFGMHPMPLVGEQGLSCVRTPPFSPKGWGERSHPPRDDRRRNWWYQKMATLVTLPTCSLPGNFASIHAVSTSYSAALISRLLGL